jgi:hypothetical protein
MPPKKDKKKKPKAKRIRMAAAPPQFGTGFNRQIPGGIIGTGGGGGMNAPGLTPASFLGASLAKQVTQTAPIQTPDQFTIIQEQKKQGKVLEDIVEEQNAAKRGRKTDAMKAEALGLTIEELRLERKQKKAPATPITSMTMTERVKEETTPRMAAPTEPPPSIPNASINKIGKPKRDTTAMREVAFGSPPVMGSAEYPGGISMNQQGMFMGMASSIRGSPPDGSTSLTGLNPIGDFDGTLE